MLIEDGGIVVLGGLIQEGDTRGEQRVPYLGRIPILGALFKTRSRNTEKNNLMVFIRPKILRDGLATAIATDAKYNYIRSEQEKAGRPKSELLPLIPYTKEPRLPPIPPPLARPDDGAPAPAVASPDRLRPQTQPAPEQPQPAVPPPPRPQP